MYGSCDENAIWTLSETCLCAEIITAICKGYAPVCWDWKLSERSDEVQFDRVSPTRLQKSVTIDVSRSRMLKVHCPLFTQLILLTLSAGVGR